MFANWATRLPEQEAANNADQSEQKAMSAGSINVEEGVRDEKIADALDPFDVPGPTVERWAKVDAAVETGAGAIADELKRRASVMGEKYPFRLERNALIYSGSHTLVYELCLAI